MIARCALALLLIAMSASSPATAQSTRANANEITLGDIVMVGFNFCPRGMMPANGQTLSISSYSPLFALYGVMYGGDGRTTFSIPNLAGRTPIHQGDLTVNGRSVLYRTGQSGGSLTHTLTAASMPRHNHPVHASSNPPSNVSPAGRMLATFTSGPPRYDDAGAPDLPMAGGPNGMIGSSGGYSTPFDNTNPVSVVTYCVVVSGYAFPHRN